MAVRPVVTTRIPGFMSNADSYKWSLILAADTADVLEFPANTDRTVQIDGTFGSNGSLSIQGSNDGVTYFNLTDPQGNAITKTAAGIETIVEMTRYIKPVMNAGDGNTSLNVTLFARRG